MAENGRQNGEVNRQKMPVTPAPSRSQTNLESRAPGIEKRPLEISGRGTPQAAAKPPPAEVEKAGRRSTDAAGIPGEVRDASRSGKPEAREDFRKDGRRWSPASAAAQVLLAAVCIITGMFAQPRNRMVRSVSPSQVPAVKATTVASEQNPYSAGFPGDPGRAFSTALDDLDNAVVQRPESPEEILRTVSRTGEDCSLAWIDRFPSLVFGKKTGPNSIALTLEGCARAISRLPQ
jgi:hypothetical protein